MVRLPANNTAPATKQFYTNTEKKIRRKERRRRRKK
jgi:hypothetical protein